MELNKIPKELYIAGQKITIEIDDTLSYNDELAAACNHKNSIKICKNFKGNNLSDDMIEQSLWHEITHHILYKMNEFELTSNERFVQTFSLLLHQVIKTLK
ncbi:hypothetical protein RPMD05_68 [Rhodobacteraceae phage LS06-2018-MD05]|nr:hypothetical protein RPMD05_68 [Rhodobacteraceae phage LS06-2018-MD05]